MFQDFINKWIGQSYDGDNAYGAQCVDFTNMFIKEFGGVRPTAMRVSGGAKDYYQDFPNSGVRAEWGCERIANQVNNFPIPGDIVVWNSQMGGGYGHCAVADENCTPNTLRVIEQNGGRGTGTGRDTDSIRRVTYSSYENVLGWIRIPEIYQNVYMSDNNKLKGFAIYEPSVTSVPPTPIVTSYTSGPVQPAEDQLRKSLIEAFTRKDFDTATREHLINAVNGNDGEYIAEFAGLDARKRADEAVAHAVTLQINLNNAATQIDRLQGQLMDYANSGSQDNRRVTQMAERNAENEKRIEDLLLEIQLMNEKLADPATGVTPVKEKWDLQTFLVGATKKFVNHGSFATLAATFISFIVFFVTDRWPELKPYEPQILNLILYTTGITVTGQNILEFSKYAKA